MPDDPTPSSPDPAAVAGDGADAAAPPEEALAQAQAAVDDLAAAAGGLPIDPADLSAEAPGIDLLGDVDLQVTVELGQTEMLVEDVLKLASGSVVELDKLAGDPVDVYVNNRLIARGEVLVLNDNFCIRISQIVDDLHEQAQAAVEQEAAAD